MVLDESVEAFGRGESGKAPSESGSVFRKAMMETLDRAQAKRETFPIYRFEPCRGAMAYLCRRPRKVSGENE